MSESNSDFQAKLGELPWFIHSAIHSSLSDPRPFTPAYLSLSPFQSLDASLSSTPRLPTHSLSPPYLATRCWVVLACLNTQLPCFWIPFVTLSSCPPLSPCFYLVSGSHFLSIAVGPMYVSRLPSPPQWLYSICVSFTVCVYFFFRNDKLPILRFFTPLYLRISADVLVFSIQFFHLLTAFSVVVFWCLYFLYAISQHSSPYFWCFCIRRYGEEALVSSHQIGNETLRHPSIFISLALSLYKLHYF